MYKSSKFEQNINIQIWRVINLRNPINMIINALSDIRTMHDFSYTVPKKLEMNFGTKNIVTIQKHLHAKFIRDDNNQLYLNK